MTSNLQLDLDRRIEIAAQLAVRARAYFDTFRFLEAKETRPLIVGAMDDFYWYFWHQHHTHRFAFIVEIAGLFKRQRGTVNLPNLVDKVRSSMTELGWAQLSAKLDAIKGIAAKVILLRNEAIAHRSGDSELEAVFVRADVTRDELEQLAVAAIEIANQLCQVRNLRGVAALTNEVEADMRRLFRRLGADIPLTEMEAFFGRD